MNLIELYALTAGQKISKMDIEPKFYPLPFENYIVFQPFSKPSKNYSFWESVLDIIAPVLEEKNIKIVQVGGKGENGIPRCFNTAGSTSFGQLAYLINGAKLVLTSDSISSHIAGHYDKPLVVLVSNNYANCVRPYFGNKENQTVFEPKDRKVGIKPSFSFQENPKTIDTIKPEEIAAAVFKLLNIPFEFNFETLFFGDYYANRIIESVPDQALDIGNLGIDNLIVRMDYSFNEDVLFRQLAHCPCTIYTDRPINVDALRNLKPNIKQIIYEVQLSNFSLSFVQGLQKLGINYLLMSYEKDEDLNAIKIDLFDYSPIIRRDMVDSKYLIKMKDRTPGPKELYYKSNKFTLSNQKIFQSKFDWMKDSPIPSLNSVFKPIAQDIEMMRELDFFWVAEK